LQTTHDRYNHPVQIVSISALTAAGTDPELSRPSGLDENYVQALAEGGHFPPILVDRHTMRVIDGRHRLAAAILQGRHDIDAVLLDDTTAVRRQITAHVNLTHGLPLSLRDRRHAAIRIILSRTDWSDRAIADAAGLSDKTIAALRRAIGDAAETDTRIGRDGLRRRLDIHQRRAVASRLFAHHPSASLREVAGASGISVSTAHNVRQRLRGGASAEKNAAGRLPPSDRNTALSTLKADPSLRFSNSGRALLRWLAAFGNETTRWPEFADRVPARSRPQAATLARNLAHQWDQLADILEQRHIE
jgi:ParB-like chromosome segregation protein Spo0J